MIRIVAKRLWRKISIYFLLGLVTIIVLFPIYWMFVISLKTPKEIYREHYLFPSNITWDNYIQVLTVKRFPLFIRNSLLVATLTTICTLFIGVPAAYSLVRFKYRYRDWIGRFILFAYLTPSTLLFIPLSVIIAKLRLGDTFMSLIMVYTAFSTPLCIWLLMGFYKSIPIELEEQAMVDGCTRLGALIRIVLPLSASAMIAVSALNFVGAWNELLFALIFISSPDKQTVPIGLLDLINDDVYLWGPIMAGSVLSALPMTIFYYLSQRFLIQKFL